MLKFYSICSLHFYSSSPIKSVVLILWRFTSHLIFIKKRPGMVFLVFVVDISSWNCVYNDKESSSWLVIYSMMSWWQWYKLITKLIFSILPDGLGTKVNEQGIAHYNNIIDTLLDKGMESFALNLLLLKTSKNNSQTMLLQVLSHMLLYTIGIFLYIFTSQWEGG